MVTIANNEQVLKQRIRRFFAGNNKGRQQVNTLCQSLQQQFPLYLFGGAVRDIAVNGITAFNSDLDLVINCSPEQLSELVQQVIPENWPITQNKFGGYRIQTAKWLVDIWPLQQTWAFVKHHVQYEGVHSLLETTVLNWDAVIYDYNNDSIICHEEYFAELSSGHLDVVLLENPNPIGQAVRILRALFQQAVNTISPQLARYLTRVVHLYSETKLTQYEAKSYRSRFLHSANWPVLYFQLNQTAVKGKIPVDLLQKNMVLPLD